MSRPTTKLSTLVGSVVGIPRVVRIDDALAISLDQPREGPEHVVATLVVVGWNDNQDVSVRHGVHAIRQGEVFEDQETVRRVFVYDNAGIPQLFVVLVQ